MKIRNDSEVDILTMEVSEEKIDYAEEVGGIIVHFTEKGKPVVLEILDASEFLTQTTKIAMQKKAEGIVESEVWDH